jgi:hypothetical protein
MIGQVFIRILLVITLIVSAHLIRPFSLNNFTNHIIQSSITFKSILPESQGARFDHASLLAMTLNQILFSGKQQEDIPVPSGSLDVAMDQRFESHSCSNENDPPLRIPRPEVLAKRSIRVESAAKVDELITFSSETYQVESDVRVAAIRSNPVEIEVQSQAVQARRPSYVHASSPINLPVIHTNPSCARLKLRPSPSEPLKIHPTHYYLLNYPRKVGCDSREKKKVKYSALFYLDKRTLSVLRCKREENAEEDASNATVDQPLSPEPKPTEMQETETFDLFIIRPKGESCSIN